MSPEGQKCLPLPLEKQWCNTLNTVFIDTYTSNYWCGFSQLFHTPKGHDAYLVMCIFKIFLTNWTMMKRTYLFSAAEPWPCQAGWDSSCGLEGPLTGESLIPHWHSDVVSPAPILCNHPKETEKWDRLITLICGSPLNEVKCKRWSILVFEKQISFKCTAYVLTLCLGISNNRLRGKSYVVEGQRKKEAALRQLKERTGFALDKIKRVSIFLTKRLGQETKPTLWWCEVYMCNSKVPLQYRWENEFVDFSIIF